MLKIWKKTYLNIKSKLHDLCYFVFKIFVFRILNFTNEEWKKTIDAYRQLERDVNLAKQAALAAKQQLEDAYKIMKPIGSDSIHDRASLMYADSTRLLARVENNKNIPSKSHNI